MQNSSTAPRRFDDLTIMAKNNESSYHLNSISFEDSHVDNFQEACSPSILVRRARTAVFNFGNDESGVEERRGMLDDTCNKVAAQFPMLDETQMSGVLAAELSTSFRLGKYNPIPAGPLVLINNDENKNASSRNNSLQIVQVKSKNSLSISSSTSSIHTLRHLEETIYASSSDSRTRNLSDLLLPHTAAFPNTKQQQSFLAEVENKILHKRLEFVDMTENTINESNARLSVLHEEKEAKDEEQNSSKSGGEMSAKKVEFTGKSIENSLAVDSNGSKKSANKEMATQTSFLLSDDPDRRNTNKRLSLMQSDSIQKHRLRKMIEVQRHEKKSKELEVLAKLERLEAERLRKQMLESELDASSLLLNDSSLNLSQMLASKIGAYNKMFKLNLNETSSDDLTIVSSVKNEVSPVKETRVQAVKLNMSCLKRPDVMIIKENDLLKDQAASLKARQPKHFISPNSSLNKTEKKHEQSVFLEIEKIDSGDQAAKMSLQEAFLTYKRDLLERSNQRQRAIEERARHRREQAEYEKKCAIEADLRRREEKLTLAMKARHAITSIGQKRSFSAHEIREITRKNYERLPEVKQKQHLENIEKCKRLNRIRSNIYKKAIQHHLFTRGPNFNLNYKALNN